MNWWSRLVGIIAEELEKTSENLSCIMATSVILNVLSHLGVDNAYPLTVKPRILNPKFAERLKHEPFPSTPEELAKWEADGCSIVSVGYPKASSKNQWNGHLIAIIPRGFNNRNWALDITITQANLPEWGIELDPLMMSVSEEFLNGTKEFKASINNSLVVYWAFPADRSFEDTPIWQESEKRDYIVRQILSRL